jgi:hypothetical protein
LLAVAQGCVEDQDIFPVRHVVFSIGHEFRPFSGLIPHKERASFQRSLKMSPLKARPAQFEKTEFGLSALRGAKGEGGRGKAAPAANAAAKIPKFVRECCAWDKSQSLNNGTI